MLGNSDASCVMPESTLQSGRWRSAASEQESRGGGSEDGYVARDENVSNLASLDNGARSGESDGGMVDQGVVRVMGMWTATSEHQGVVRVMGDVDGNYGAPGGGEGDGECGRQWGMWTATTEHQEVVRVMGDVDGYYGAPGGGEGDGGCGRQLRSTRRW